MEALCPQPHHPPFTLYSAPHTQIEALRPISAGILSERRAVRPFGLLGGGPALPGVNLLIRASGRVVNLGEGSEGDVQLGGEEDL